MKRLCFLDQTYNNTVHKRDPSVQTLKNLTSKELRKPILTDVLKAITDPYNVITQIHQKKNYKKESYSGLSALSVGILFFLLFCMSFRIVILCYVTVGDCLLISGSMIEE